MGRARWSAKVEILKMMSSAVVRVAVSVSSLVLNVLDFLPGRLRTTPAVLEQRHCCVLWPNLVTDFSQLEHLPNLHICYRG